MFVNARGVAQSKNQREIRTTEFKNGQYSPRRWIDQEGGTDWEFT